MPSFKKSLIVEQFQVNYLKVFLFFKVCLFFSLNSRPGTPNTNRVPMCLNNS